MTSEDVRYESKTVHTMRGAEARAKVKWERAGWEFVEESPDSMLRTKLTFRKRAPKRPPLVVLVGLGVLVVAGISLAAFFEEDDPADQTAALPSVAASVEPSEAEVRPTPSQSSRPSESPSAEPTGAEETTVETQAADPDPSASIPSETLTIQNSAELAVVLRESDPASAVIEAFAANNEGALLEFDANLAYMTTHGDYTTRFDFLVKPGDYSETSQSGPNFKFEDVNIVSDLKLNGPDIPDSIGAGQNVRIIARVESYNPVQELFFLEPVSTQMR